jgi:hypothetical protein
MMKSWFDKLEKLDRVKSVVGMTTKSREVRAENFINNLNNKGRKKAKQWLSDFEKIVGKDFVEQAQLAQWANQFGDGGTGAWLPRWTTGRSLWAKGAGAAIGSPKIASRFTIPAVQAVSDRTSTQLSAPVQTGIRQAIRTPLFRDFEME